MNIKWKVKKVVIMQARGLLLARRSQRLRRAGAGAFDNNFDESLDNCVRNTMTTIFVSRIFPSDGKYAEMLRDKFRNTPKITVAKLRKWGMTDEMILELTQIVTGTTVNTIYQKIEQEIQNEK